VQALPLGAYFLFLEAAVGGVIALFLVHLRGEVPRGYTLFTGWCLLGCGALALWVRSTFPPAAAVALSPEARVWYQAERTLAIAFVVLLAIYLLMLQLQRRGARGATAGAARDPRAAGGSRQALVGLLGPIVPLVGLGALWCAALVDPSAQILGIGVPLAVMLGSLALGAVLAGLSLGHWYLVSPALGTRPLIRLVFLCLGALVAQVLLLPLQLFLPGGPDPRALFGEYGLFFAVRVVFGLAVPLAVAVMAWRTARIRSLDAATGLLYILAALVLTGEITARALYFLTNVAT
jgi:DMSO reductase anchor subunit